MRCMTISRSPRFVTAVRPSGDPTGEAETETGPQGGVWRVADAKVQEVGLVAAVREREAALRVGASKPDMRPIGPSARAARMMVGALQGAVARPCWRPVGVPACLRTSAWRRGRELGRQVFVEAGVGGSMTVAGGRSCRLPGERRRANRALASGAGDEDEPGGLAVHRSRSHFRS